MNVNDAQGSTLTSLLRKYGEQLGDYTVTNPEFLDSAVQTGFVWAEVPGSICLALGKGYFRRALSNRNISVVIAPPGVAHGHVSDKAVIELEHAEELFYLAHIHAVEPPVLDSPVISEDAFVHPSAVVEGEVTLEAGVQVGPGCILSGSIVVGEGTTIEAGAILGAEGLYSKRVLGENRHIPHYGGVTIGRNCYIHAGAVIVRSAIKGDATRIADDVHVGIMANVGHDVCVGAGSVLSSNVVIAGRARLGKGVWIGASACVSNAITVGDNAKVRIGAICITDVPRDAEVSGNFALPHSRTLRQFMEARRGSGNK